MASKFKLLLFLLLILSTLSTVTPYYPNSHGTSDTVETGTNEDGTTEYFSWIMKNYKLIILMIFILLAAILIGIVIKYMIDSSRFYYYQKDDGHYVYVPPGYTDIETAPLYVKASKK